MKTNFLITMMAASLTSVCVLAASAPVFYPGNPEQPRIQFLKAINGSSAFITGNGYGDRFPNYKGHIKNETNPIVKPYGLAVTQGKIFVCDAGTGTVKIFDLEKKMIGTIGDQKIGKLGMPMNIAIDADGTRYVADTALMKIMVYNSNNTFVKEISGPDKVNPNDPEKMKPTDVVILKGKLYVTDVANSQIVVIDPKTGAIQSRFSQAGVEAGDLFKATNLTTDAAGNIFVADTIGGKVSVFSDAGKYLRSYGGIGDQLGHFARPKGVAVDRENRLYAIDAAFENVQVFNNEGKLLLPFGVAGNTDGGLNMPAKVVVDYNNTKYFKDQVAPGYDIDYLIYVTNQFGDNKVNVYGFLKKL